MSLNIYQYYFKSSFEIQKNVIIMIIRGRKLVLSFELSRRGVTIGFGQQRRPAAACDIDRRPDRLPETRAAAARVRKSAASRLQRR